MPASTVPAAKSALLALATTALPASVKVARGRPTDESDMASEMFFLGRARQTEEWGQTGSGGRRDEEYDLQAFVHVHKFGDDERATEERAWELRELFVAALRADVTLGGVLSKWCEVTDTDENSTALTDGWMSELQLTIHCEAARI